ncbi:tetratricopeptide repeat protein [Chloroflexi bacterium TSY]|nr:tetratricopeptide repeat protein [Chloroflexi bacterium TSY]
MSDKPQQTEAGRDASIGGNQYDIGNIDSTALILGDGGTINVNQPAQKPPLYVNVPSKPNHFVGRDELVEKVVGQLLSGQHLVLSAEGLPGVGKTTLAVTLAHHPDVLTHFKDGVLWAGLGKQPDVMGILAIWAEELGRDVSGLGTAAERVQAVKTAIGQSALLLVIDDAWDLDAAKLLRCGGANCCHILTTRNQSIARDFAGKSQIETVPVLDDETAYQLLVELADEACTVAPDVVRKLVKSVGGLPLTLELLGGYLSTAQHSRYPELARASLSQMLSPQERLQLATQRLGATNSPEISLQETIMLSLEDKSLSKEAVSTFYALGAFAPKPVSFDRSAAVAVAETNLNTLAMLASRNLLDDSQGLENLTLHQELANTARTRTPPEAIERHRAYYLALVNEKREVWKEIESVYGQIQWAWAAAPDDKQLIDFQRALNIYQYRRGFWSDLVAWLQRVLHLAQSQGWQAEEGICLRNLCSVYDKQGRWNDAIRMFEESLRISKELGDISGEGKTLHNLGSVYNNQGRWDDAIQIYKESLHISRELGDISGISQSTMGLGSIYDNQGRWDEAIQMYKESLRISRELADISGEGKTLHNLGSVYNNQGRWDDAIQIYKESLRISRELGDISGISQSTMGLGSIYGNQGRWDEAIQMYKESLRISRELADTYSRGKTLHNLGSIYNKQGRWDDAIQMYKESLHISKELGDISGEGKTLHNLGSVYNNQGRWDDAIQMFEESLCISRELGDISGISQSTMGLGSIYDKQGRWDEAIQMYKESLRLSRELVDISGEGKTLHNLGSVYNNQGRWDDAIQMFEESLRIKRDLGDISGEGKTLHNGSGQCLQQPGALERRYPDVQGEPPHQTGVG